MMAINQFISTAFYRICYGIHYHHALLNRIKKNQFVPILSLHRVTPEKNPFWSPLDPTIFNSLITYLKKHFHLTTFHELKNAPADRPSMILTFDDGYYDFIEYAMPILDYHDIKVNQNIIPEQLMGGKPLWNIALYDFLNAAPTSLIKEIAFPGFDAKNYLNNTFNKVRFGVIISKILKTMPMLERDHILDNLNTAIFSRHDYQQTRMIKLKEINQVIAKHEIGVHSYSHNSMGQADMTYFTQDFFKCQQFFTEHQFPHLDIYAFPNGSYRDEQVTFLRKNNVNHILLVDDEYANHLSPYQRFNIAAFNHHEALFQSLGIKSKRKSRR